MVIKFRKVSNMAQQGNVQRMPPRTHPISSKQMEQVALLGLHIASHTPNSTSTQLRVGLVPKEPSPDCLYIAKSKCS